MYSNPPGSWFSATGLLFVLICHTPPVFSSDSIPLAVVPDRCISLRKGKTCYQDVQFRWKLEDMSNLDRTICLWREGESVALACWNGKSEGVFRYSLAITKSTGFHLAVGLKPLPVIGSTRVTVNWVYKNRGSRRARWRLF